MEKCQSESSIFKKMIATLRQHNYPNNKIKWGATKRWLTYKICIRQIYWKKHTITFSNSRVFLQDLQKNRHGQISLSPFSCTWWLYREETQNRQIRSTIDKSSTLSLQYTKKKKKKTEPYRPSLGPSSLDSCILTVFRCIRFCAHVIVILFSLILFNSCMIHIKMIVSKLHHDCE